MYNIAVEEILFINKPVGVTSYDVIRDLKKKYPGEKIGHAGTLDPLAEGLLICLVGKDATKRQMEFMGKDKVYEFEFMLGVQTDTSDILGLILNSSSYAPESIKQMPVNAGKFQQQIPPFSAVKIKGKPLYRWYLSGQIDQVEIPTNEVEIYEIEELSRNTLSKPDIEKRITEILNTVKSGFRNEQVKETWIKFFAETTQENFLLVKMKAHVSKGTYIRSIVEKIGQDLGMGATCLNIKRTQVGDIKL